MKKYGLLSLKILLWIIGSVIFLVLLVFVLIEVPAVQNFARKKAVTYLQNKIGTKVEINHISLDLPKMVVLEDVYFEDQKRDTLLAGDTLKVDISMMKLLNNEVEINEIDLRGITANIQRTLPDSAFNFDYIIKAFVSEQKKPEQPQDTTSSMKFSVEKINLDRIRTRFKDAVTANDVAVYLGHFDTRIKDFDLDKMKFGIPKITLSGLNATIIQSKPAATPEPLAKDEAESNEPINMALQLGTIDLKKIKVDYQNAVSAMKAKVNLGSVEVESDKLDLKGQNIALKTLNLNNSDIQFSLGKKEEAKVVAKEAGKEVQTQANSWKLSLANLNLADNNIQFDNYNLPVQKRGLDFAHLNIKDFTLDAEDFIYAIDTIAGKINNGSFTEKSGFNLTKFTTNFFYGKHEAYLNDLDIQTPVTRLQNQIRVSYPSIESLSSNLGALSIDANLDNSRLGFHDILALVPTLASTDPFRKNPNAILNINGEVKGQLKNLTIPYLQISGLGNTKVDASARITGLPDVNKSIFDIRINNFSTTRTDIAGFIPAGTLPANIRLPETFNLKGTFAGAIADFNTNLDLNSSYGSAKAIASFNSEIKGRETYKANVKIFNFNAGRLIAQEKTIGRITLAANVVGTGTNPKNLTADLSAKVIKAVYNGYTYRNLNVKATSKNRAITAKANMNDPNLDFDLSARASMNKKYPSVALTLNLDSVNLQNLHFTKDDMRFHGKVVADVPTADPDYLNGKIQLTNLLYAKGPDRYQLDTVSVVSTASADSSSLHLKSEALSANIAGDYKLSEIGTAFESLINRYFSVNPASNTTKYSPQQFTFNAQFVNAPIVSKLVPDLKEMANVNLGGNFDSRNGTFKLDATAPKVNYAGNILSNLRLNINTAEEKLSYSLKLDQISSSQLQLINTSIGGDVQNDVLTTDVQVRDKNNKQHYRIAGSLKSIPDAFVFSLQPDGLILNYQPWTVSTDNAIQFGKKGIDARNFVISMGNQQLKINTNPPGANNPLAVDFSNFKIETLTQIAKKDSLLLGGTINGNVLVRNLQTTPVFTSDLTIGDFNFRGDTVGNIALKVNNERENTFAAKVDITGNGNQVGLDGYYFTQNSSFDLDLNIGKLNLKSIQGFTMGSLTQASGSLNGKLDITGTADAPKIRGDINFDNTAFNISMFNSYYKVNDKISFTDDGIEFNDFTITDSANNTLDVDGTVFTKTYTDYRFGLTVSADNFQVLNSTAKNNELYYGQLFINTRLNIGGDMAQPSVDGSLKINPKTKLTVVLPQTNPAIEERKGIVEFVDKDNPNLAKTLTSKVDSSENQSEITGMDVAVNITIDKEAEFNLIVDAANGDFLKLRGEAELSGGIDPSGKTSLTGTYEMEEGAYELSFNFLRRRFDIKPGSTITWNGDVMDANLDVTAIYVAETAPLDLVQAQLGDAAPAALNIYKQKLPFEVHLNMKGELMKPAITFDIVLPEKNYNVSSDVTNNVETRLTQLKTEPSELNKQVFALLLLNRFVSDNPFKSSAGGGGVESLARQSVSKILSQQLNNLAGDLIGGVELNFDLESSEDYTTGELKNRTDLNVGLSKRLLNDRLQVTVGSNFELEGPQQPNRNTSNIAGNVEIEYQLSKDGRYLLRAYQKNEYQVALQGQVIETGVGFVITMDYNKFKQIFAKAKTEEEKKRRREERKARRKANENG
ncbi:translocation/assembly module TamB domain-containing protein [Rubrolithibacter danxiaensis]|uniref:translocation/assembly module TamB domain-containing protein n=1 Tax=Rubrolithibacter danxiaensis TaxID=3390805 RepID=UPI003BF8918C